MGHGCGRAQPTVGRCPGHKKLAALSGKLLSMESKRVNGMPPTVSISVTALAFLIRGCNLWVK